MNGDAETGAAAASESDRVQPSGWEAAAGNFTAAQYGASGLPSAAEKAPNGGNQFFAGGPGGTSSVSQDVKVEGSAAAIDQSSMQARLEGDLGGWKEQADNAEVETIFFDNSGKSLGSGPFIGNVGPAARGSKTGFVHQSASRPVPAGTRLIKVVITARRSAGSYNDGYADNLSLTLEQGTAKPQPKGNLRFSVLVKGEPWLGARTLFPSFAGTRVAGSGAFAQKATHLQAAVGTIVVEQNYLTIPDVKTTIQPTGEGSYVQGVGSSTVRMKVTVKASNFTACPVGRTGHVNLTDTKSGADVVTLSLCRDLLVYKNGKPKGTIVKVFVSRA